jgi:hypothetical protein
MLAPRHFEQICVACWRIFGHANKIAAHTQETERFNR